MAALTLEQGKQVHALALLFNAFNWWTVEYDKKFNCAGEYHKTEQPLPFGSYGRSDIQGWGNWYDFSTQETAYNFINALYDLDIEGTYSETTTNTVFINW